MEILNKEAELTNKSVEDVFLNRKILWVSTTVNLESVLKIMKDNNIISIPVMDLVQNSCLGVVDVLDIVTFIIERFPSVEKITAENLRNLEYSGIYFGREVQIGQLINYSRRNINQNIPSFVELKTPLLGLIDIFGQGVHRVPVLDKTSGKLINFISQSDLLRYFAENMYLIGTTAFKTIFEMNLVKGGVHYCKINAPFIFALAMIALKKVSALPVVDDNEIIRATVSASDLRGLGPQDFPNLLKSVADYLLISHPKSLFPITCKPTDTMEYVILKLAATKVHRLWCIDENGKILGILSITDVMKSFIQCPMELNLSFPLFNTGSFVQNKSDQPGGKIPIM